jgi:hypothetical protein
MSLDIQQEIRSSKQELVELKNDLSNAVATGDKEERLALQNRITATTNQLTELYKLLQTNSGMLNVSKFLLVFLILY